jgi:hypothetical protein
MMKRLIAALLLAAFAVPAVAAEHGGPWELVYDPGEKAPAPVTNDFHFTAPPQ